MKPPRLNISTGEKSLISNDFKHHQLLTEPRPLLILVENFVRLLDNRMWLTQRLETQTEDIVVDLLAARRLGVEPSAVIAFEDSGRGVQAAKAAGARCVAVPHILSRSHDFTAADHRVDPLSLFDLDEVLARGVGAAAGLPHAEVPGPPAR